MYGAKKTESVQIYTTPNQHERWETAAKQFDLSLAAFVRAVVDQFIQSKDFYEQTGKHATLMGRVAYKEN